MTKKSTTERVEPSPTGEVRRRTVDCWDAEGGADGVVWAKRFRRASLAQAWKESLDADITRGPAFDLRSKQCLLPDQAHVSAALAAPTVFELTELYFRQQPEWEPATEESAARSFNWARRWLRPARVADTQLSSVDSPIPNSGAAPAIDLFCSNTYATPSPEAPQRTRASHGP